MLPIFPNKLLRYGLLTAMGAVLIAACRSNYATVSPDYSLNKTHADVAHGKALLINSCGGCHYDPKTGHFTGKRMMDLPGILGKTYSANLTASKAYSPVPYYTDAELAYLLRTGIKRDGHFVPYMLRPNISDNDLRDLIAYLRSGEDVVAATDTMAGRTHLNFLGKLALHFAGKPQPFHSRVPHPASQLEQGRYLVDNIGCFHCHSKSLTSLNYLHPEQSKGYLAGGAGFKKPKGGKIRGANITLDNETGIGFYTKADFRQAVQHMTAPGNRKLHPPMEAFKLTDEEADAIYAYLQTVAPVHHQVKGQPKVALH